MWTGGFELTEGVIWLRVRVSGPSGHRLLDCILDTGTPQTILDTSILGTLGYSARMGTRIVNVSGVGGRLSSYELPISRLEVMDLELEQFLVLSQDIVPDDMGVDGLIGMDVLVGHVLTIDGRTGAVNLVP